MHEPKIKKLSSKKPPNNYPLSSIIFSVILLIAILAFYYIKSNHSVQPKVRPPRVVERKEEKVSNEHWNEVDIERLKWKKSKLFDKNSFPKGNFPYIFTNTFVNYNFKPIDWDYEYLENRTSSKEINNVFENSNEIFGPYFDNRKPMSKISSVKPINPYKVVKMESSKFWSLMRSKQHSVGSNYFYYSDNVNNFIEEVDVSDDLKGLENLEIVSQDDENLQNMNIWIGQKDVVTHAHFDSYDNLIVQIKGRKRWVLFPPDAKELYHFPFLHPSHAQSMVDLVHVNKRLFDRFKGVTAYSGVLNPGEVLYVPAFWTHFVVALSPSISLNGWTYTNQTRIVKNIFDVMDVYSPLDKYTKLMEKVVAAKALLYSILKGIDPALSLKEEVDNVFEYRYNPIVKMGQLSVDASQYKDFNEFCSTGFSKQQFTRLVSVLEKDPSVTKLYRLFKDLQDDVRMIWFHNFIEYILATCINIEKLPILLASNCFSIN